MAQYLNLPQGPEHGPCQALSAILACTKNGFGGNKRKKTQVFTGFDGVDLMNQNNNIGICYQQWGKREAFSRGTLSDAPLMREPRWFKFGNNCKIEVVEQIEIGRELIGDVTLGDALDDPAAIPMYIAKRRKESLPNSTEATSSAVCAIKVGTCQVSQTDILTCGMMWHYQT